MSAPDPDRLIGSWLREELDAVPEPTRAVRDAVDAAAITAQNRGRLRWLQQLLGLDTTITHHGRPERPEIVLGPPDGASGSGSAVVRGAGATSLPVITAAVLASALLLAVAAWFVVGPGGVLLGGARSEGTTVPEQPQRPLDPPGPDRVIVVGPVDGHFRTLAGAVAAAQAGDRIELRPGRYQAEVVIDEAITIAGAGDREAVVVEPRPVPTGADPREHTRDVFTLRGVDATLQGFTVRGSSNGTAVRIDGGSPLLDDLVIDPEGEMALSGPNQPRQAVVVEGGASPTIRGSLLTSLSGIVGGATPLFEDVTIEGSCLLIEGEGTAPVIRDTAIRDSQCPGFGISVALGAGVTLEASRIESPEGTSGIRVANDGSSADISGSEISGGREGVLASFGAEVEIYRTNVHGADVGVRVLDADLVLQHGALLGNGVGLEVSGESYLETMNTDICDNGLNLDLRDGAMVPLELNRVCVDGTSEIGSVAGS